MNKDEFVKKFLEFQRIRIGKELLKEQKMLDEDFIFYKKDKSKRLNR